MADAYIGLGDYDKARSTLKNALDTVNNVAAIQNKLDNLLDEPTNIYGGTEFSHRQEYVAFENYSPEDQQFIADFASAAITGDIESAKELLGYELEQGEKRYTSWNGYKLRVYSSGEELTDGGDRSASAEICMRPENGSGYIFSVQCIDAVASLKEEVWSNAVFVERTVCPCTDWQWNGTMSYICDYYHDTYFTNGETCNSVDHEVVNGNMVFSLRDGAFSIEKHMTSKWGRRSSYDTDEYASGSAYYEQGVLQSVSGDDSVTGGNKGMLADIEGTYYDGSLNDQWVLDAFYW